MQLFNISKWIGVSVGLGIFLLMLVSLILLRKRSFIYYIAIPVNGLASGIALSSLYVYLGKFPEIWQTASVFGALVAAVFLYCLLTRLKFFQYHYVICIVSFIVILFAISITCYICVDNVVFSLAMISLIPVIATLISLVAEAENDFSHIKNNAYCSFTALIIIIIVVLITISQGEGLDGLGDGIDFVGGNSKKKNPYEYFSH